MRLFGRVVCGTSVCVSEAPEGEAQCLPGMKSGRRYNAGEPRADSKNKESRQIFLPAFLIFIRAFPSESDYLSNQQKRGNQQNELQRNDQRNTDHEALVLGFMADQLHDGVHHD